MAVMADASMGSHLMIGRPKPPFDVSAEGASSYDARSGASSNEPMPLKNILKSLLALAARMPALAVVQACVAGAPLDIESRRELFVDDS
ncbi:MAG: hypothetical protein M3463_06900 [Verrucomicrobiota bacterium]|nr:hypothetical protein [Verrucomicrobiota bacterium]